MLQTTAELALGGMSVRLALLSNGWRLLLGDERCDTTAMPWWPKDYDGAVVDHRLDPYRDRGADISDNGEPVMRVFVQVDLERQHAAGHLWWRRWSPPREFVVLHMLMRDGLGADSWLSDEVLSDELDDWFQGRFKWDGKPMRIDWFDASQSQTMREELGLDER